MWPRTLGSVQPLRAPQEAPRPLSKSKSAPQLCYVSSKQPPTVLFAFTPALVSEPQPRRCHETLLSTDQLTTLALLPAADALSLLVSCLPLGQQSETHAQLLYTVYRWARRSDFDNHKTSVLLAIYLDTHRYCLASPWRTQQQMYAFFKESLLRNSVHHSPHSTRVFSAHDCRDSLLQFCHSYLTVLPLIRLTCHPNYRLTLSWTSTSEEHQINSQLM